jgi:hypothetical protein
MKSNRVATTIKVEPDLYDDFKILGVRHKLTLQGLVERSIYLYVKDETFRSTLNNFFLPASLKASFSAASASFGN